MYTTPSYSNLTQVVTSSRKDELGLCLVRDVITVQQLKLTYAFCHQVTSAIFSPIAEILKLPTLLLDQQQLILVVRL